MPKITQKEHIMSEDLKLWNEVRTIDPQYTKNVSVSGKPAFTNIDAYHLVEKATGQFGGYGKGFGFKELKIEEIHLGDTILVKLTGVFFYPDGEFPVFNAMKLVYKTTKGYEKVDEDAYKKIITNTIGKALSYLGFGADIYMGKFEDQAYVDEVINDFATEEYHGYIDVIRDYIDKAQNKDVVTEWVLKRAAAERVETINFESAKEIAKLIAQKQKRSHESA